MKLFGLLGLVVVTILMVSAQEKVPDGFQQWTPASLEDLAQTLKTEADASSHHMAVRQLLISLKTRSSLPGDRRMASWNGTRPG